MEFQIPKKVETLGEDIQRSELKYHSKRVGITKEFTFDAAHHLHCYDGKCKNLHGHTYKLVITVSGYVNDVGISVDFGDIKRIYNETIKAKLDHRYLNEVLPNMNTTAENMIVWIWEQLDARLHEEGLKQRGHRLEELVLYETPTSSAVLKREWMEDDE
ncbi:6-carboxytetrahydropterin synthase QueD [Desertibacillus haloalkaliphilus]|uniref:6-carboxytetrahydropterin synthase QueD n=1 Tax=Desertibacillus haloalkaliphilus TaxID=1328930 RepID=UPI001C253AC7|nr:6-carboxytetrahydropterin synthase QueD [Desertibacillus haloalkaliphilus]MBU8905243.1 6-carboxytetrahydropterin synthase QueD [Desertibacillus haloalkaliphilus]